MSSRTHNKKRNTGVIYEQLLKKTSAYLVEGDKRKAQVCLNILERHFKAGTELYKEFRLFNALANCQITSSPAAAVVMTEARDASRRTSRDRLEEEKSRLIGDINRKIGADFFDTFFERYREYATIQVLLNEWRSTSPNIDLVFDYEKKLVESLMRPRDVSPTTVDPSSPDVSQLVVDIMTEKLNKKFSSSLTDEQRGVIRDYIFSPIGSDQTALREKMHAIKQRAIRDLDTYLQAEKNDVIMEQAGGVRSRLNSLSLESIDDVTVVKFLTAAKLSQEIREGGS